ncbi:hypothetical protein MMC20_000332 [Loxospora ochrophaea]|nr:hypothetical protein [Loxospora ochrophaea]
MIPPHNRLWSPSGNLYPGGPHTWHVIDWDQRRYISVTGSAEAFPEEEQAIEALGKFIDQLGPEVHEVEISDDGELLSTSSNPCRDITPAVHYPHYPEPLDDEIVLRRSQLIEDDRVSAAVDLVHHENQTDGSKKLMVFKYAVLWQRIKKMWDELHLVRALGDHPSFPPFDRIILDDVQSRVLGFTSVYIPGGNLENTLRPFKFSWLEELTYAVDELNFRFGIIHQDVAPRNLAIDPITNKLKLFDFDQAARVGSNEEEEERNDVKGVIFTVYELITLDDHFRRVDFKEQNVEDVESMTEWPVRIELEGDISRYRGYLENWVNKRKVNPAPKQQSEALQPIDWPEVPAETPISFAWYNEDGTMRKDENGNPVTFVNNMSRFQGMHNDLYCVKWERPPQKEIRSEDSLHPTKKVIKPVPPEPNMQDSSKSESDTRYVWSFLKWCSLM